MQVHVIRVYNRVLRRDLAVFSCRRIFYCIPQKC